MANRRTVISAFTGAGGLDLGLSKAGFKINLGIEKAPAARRTLSAQGQRVPLSEDGDIFSTSPDGLLEQAGLRPRETTLIAAGPPCQPFSKAAFWANGTTKRLTDTRARTLDALLHLVEHALPEVVLIENVTGLGFRRKSEALELIVDRLKEINKSASTCYHAAVLRLNAASYGIPQSRQRLFVVAHREGRIFTEPPHTHGDPETLELESLKLEPYRTAWDAIGHLNDRSWDEDVELRGSYAPDFLPSIPEGQNYLWHTPEGIQRWRPNRRTRDDAYWGWRTRYWSFLLKLAKNKPSWTVQASPGPSTGPFHWKNRQLSIKELQLLQTFPETYIIEGRDRREKVRQIGNAVPPAIGELLGLEIRRQLLAEQRVRRRLKLIPEVRDDCPPPETLYPVPPEHHHMKGDHAPHRGKGKGSGAQRRLAW